MDSKLINIETGRVKQTMTADEKYEATKQKEQRLSRLLVAYIVSGLAFMVLPGTFLGVWNLISISSRHQADAMSPAWIQAHGHAQIFGWIGSFILGIGFYSIPTVRTRFAVARGWLCAAMWVSGVALRWATNVYQWEWRVALPVSAALELAAFLIFFRAVSRHEAKTKDGQRAKLDAWVWIVIVGTLGFMATLLMNFGASVYLALRGSDPAFPQEFDQRFLVMCAWGFLVPFVWGFSSKWLPIFLGLRKLNMRLLLSAVAINVAGVALAQFGFFRFATIVLLVAAVVAGMALRLFESSQSPAKVNGIHPTFPIFVRSAYVWLIVAAALGAWAARASNPAGIWGASRHALTVGFIAVMVFSIGQRVLPAFSGMRVLFSPKLMFSALSLITVGCILRVSSEILSYQDISPIAWKVLPVSALVELSGVSLFALNLVLTFVQRPAHMATEEKRNVWTAANQARHICP